MKAALVTFSTAPNFGAFFQSYATNHELRRRGVSVENFDPNTSTHYARRTWRPQNLVYRAQEKSYQKDRAIVGIAPEWTGSRAADKLLDLDAIFVGSDQVLNPNCLQGRNLDNVLLPNIRTVSKFGLAMSTYSNAVLEDVGKKKLQELKFFSKLSFREAEVARWVKEEIGIDGDAVPDPCFLLTENDLRNVARNGPPSLRGTKSLVVGYDLQRWAPTLVRSSVLPEPVRYINYNLRNAWRFGLFTKGPLQALNELLAAEVIVTNSFHFAVIGVIANKKVIVPSGHAFDGGERLRNLCRLLDFRASGKNAQIYDFPSGKNSSVEALRTTMVSYLDECFDMTKLRELKP
ncbi:MULTISPECIES: polysaccharide pyruvyl transferase family protein [unclassified Sulfitobacter]|uniref:polysaccharide pyruvyl transferase family protein n=1 Tax=unclassified Sulfitobacter TaxID=196795 RepID=UPI00374620D3